jgi:hypothetical protein
MKFSIVYAVSMGECPFVYSALSNMLIAAFSVAVGVQARHQLPSAFAALRRGNQFITGVCA